jgi:hypothetical protein
MTIPKAMAKILKDVKTRPTAPLWPHYGELYGLSRGATYKAAAEGLAKGDAEFMRVGKAIRLVTAVTRKKLGLESAA